MTIRITRKQGEWFWIMETGRSDPICISENSRSMVGGYTRRQTAIKSAERFVDDYLHENLQVTLIDEKRKVLWSINDG